MEGNFRLHCTQDLTASVAKLRLYLEDDRTVAVLVTHIQDKIIEEYEAFRDVVLEMHAGSLKDVELSRTELKEVLRGACDPPTDV